MFRKVHKKQNNGVFDSYNFPKTLFGFYWLVIKRFPWFFGTLFVCGTIGNVLSMVFGPLTSKWMIEIFESTANTNWNHVIGIFALLAGMYFFNVLLNFFVDFIRGKYQQYVHRYKLYLLYKRVYDNDISFFIDNPSGQITAQTQEVSARLNFLAEEFWVSMVGTIIGFMLVVGAMFTMNVWFVVILTLYGAIKVVWEWFMNKKLKVNNELLMDESAKYSGMRSDSLLNALNVKYFANIEYENRYIYNGRSKLIKLIRYDCFLARCQWMPTDILWNVVRLGMLVLCFLFIKDGVLAISDAVFVMSSALVINNSFDKLNGLMRRYSVQRARAQKAYDIVIADKLVTDKDSAKKLKIKDAQIVFDGVDFGYGDKAVLKKFNLNIENGEKVGIVGLSGAGKTTLVNLLLRMYDVDGGAIKINGVDIRDVTQDSLRKNISFVPQESTLFNRSILENIRYARPGASKADVIRAAKKANIHEFIMSQPNGYNTLVGNNGIKLSGGQRQRVSIARALLKDAPILMLDEATSALDSENEMLIQKSLQHAMRGKTALVIAHRLSTLRNMDRIVVIKNGKIVESGSHKQLLRSDGAYRKLWDMQTGGSIGE